VREAPELSRRQAPQLRLPTGGSVSFGPLILSSLVQ
jgi:hypothetical protein